MQFEPGTRLGPYEIVSSLGAGGMGEVYRARDTRLDRSVAIKVLPRSVSADADRRARFEREARLVATVAHPNVCALHDVGTASPVPGEDVAYLVMEHLEGETLDARLARGRIPHDEALALAAQIARGLDAAHRQRIVHRDLKPSNIMLTRAGVKLLDFGLAKAAEPARTSADATLTALGSTSPGTVLGTIPYMSPEQVEGRPSDHRADIFALGAVIYEMLTGGRAFGGESPAAVAAAILSTEPPPIAGPPALDAIVRGCLRKHPDERWQSAHDVGLQLEALRAVGTGDGPTARRSPRLPWILAAASLALALLAMVAAWSASQRTRAPDGVTPRRLALTVAPPSGSRFWRHVESTFVSVSPDGSAVAYVVAPPAGRPEVWVRKLDSTDAQRVAGSEGAISSFWSPDGRSLAFFADGKLKRAEVGGGAPVTLADVPDGVGLTGTWGSGGEILYSAVSGQNIMRVVPGSPSQVALAPDPSRNERRVVLPTFLPDGRRYLYLAGGAADHVGSIMLGSLDAPPVEIMRHQSMAQYVEPGFLLFVQDGGIVARRFDVESGTVSGTPIPVAPRVNWLHSTGVAQFSASPTGVLAYLPHNDQGRIAVFDRSGHELAQLQPPGGYQTLRVTPDGRQMLFDRLDPAVSAFDVWLQDVERGNEEKITSHIGSDVGATWLPGSGYLYSATRGGAPRLHRKASASSDEIPLSETAGPMQMFPDVSHDGRHIVFAQRAERGALQLMLLRTGEVQPQRLHPGFEGTETAPRLSPDGTLLAYVSDVSGRREVYVEPLLSPAERRTVSVGGGTLPRWSRDGRQLFYVAPSGELTSVQVSKSPLSASKPVTLFAASGRYPWADFDVSADGRFFAHVPITVAAEEPFTVLVNWPSGLNR